MDKYINVNDLITQLANCKNQKFLPTSCSMIKFIEDFPTVDVMKVRHGRWHDVYMSSASSFVGTCSVCGVSNDIPPVPSLAKYCPNCGARMDGGQDDV